MGPAAGGGPPSKRDATSHDTSERPADAPDFGFLYSSPLLDPAGKPLTLIDHNSEYSEVFSVLTKGATGLVSAASPAPRIRVCERACARAPACAHGERVRLVDQHDMRVMIAMSVCILLVAW